MHILKLDHIITGNEYLRHKNWGYAMQPDEIDHILNTPSNLCPICRKGIIVEKYGRYVKFKGCSNFPHCFYFYDKRELDDLDRRYSEVNNNMEALKNAIDRAGLHNLNMKFIKMEMGR